MKIQAGLVLGACAIAFVAGCDVSNPPPGAGLPHSEVRNEVRPRDSGQGVFKKRQADFLNRLRQADPQQRTIDRALLNEHNELGLVIDRSVEMNKIPELMRTVLLQMAREFPDEDLTVLAYAPSTPPRKIGTARLNAKRNINMPETVDDFMQRFGGSQTLDDREAAQYHDRFVSTAEADRDFDNRAYHEGATEYLGRLPDDQFHDAARTAVSQAPPAERSGLLGGIMKALAGGGAGGGSLGGIASMLGLGSSDPNQMSNEDAARLKERPEALQQTVQQKPWFIKAMGNPVVLGALTMAAAKMMSNQRRKGGGGLF
jgi:hypothetical protein